MSKDIETMINEAPVLTLDPFSTSELPAESSQAVPAELKEESLTESIPEAELTPEERKMIDSFAARIDLTDSNLVLQYGAGAQKRSLISLRRRWITLRQRIWARSARC